MTGDIGGMQVIFVTAVTPIIHNFWAMSEGSSEYIAEMCVLPPLFFLQCTVYTVYIQFSMLPPTLNLAM